PRGTPAALGLSWRATELAGDRSRRGAPRQAAGGALGPGAGRPPPAGGGGPAGFGAGPRPPPPRRSLARGLPSPAARAVAPRVARLARSRGARVRAVETGALEHDAHRREQLSQPPGARGALGQGRVREALYGLELVTTGGACVLVGGHGFRLH